MAYRDDLEAALAHADAAERELADAKSELQVDERRIAELEKQLAAAKGRAETAQAKQATRKSDAANDPATTKGGGVAVLFGVALTVVVLGTVAYLASSARPRKGSMPLPTPAPVAGTPAPGHAVDVSGSVAAASSLAASQFHDPELLSLDAYYVDENGLSQLDYGADLYYRFRSPTLAQQPAPTAPRLGAPVVDERQICRVSVKASASRGLRLGSTYNSDCGDANLPPVRCSVREIWQRARAAGAPAGALAHVELRASGPKRKWRFSITDQGSGRTVFHNEFADDCAPIGANGLPTKPR